MEIRNHSRNPSRSSRSKRPKNSRMASRKAGKKGDDEIHCPIVDHFEDFRVKKMAEFEEYKREQEAKK